nr:hypothetical protein [Marinobacter sp.]
MTNLILILGDQLTTDISALEGADPKRDRAAGTLMQTTGVNGAASHLPPHPSRWSRTPARSTHCTGISSTDTGLILRVIRAWA